MALNQLRRRLFAVAAADSRQRSLSNRTSPSLRAWPGESARAESGGGHPLSAQKLAVVAIDLSCVG